MTDFTKGPWRVEPDVREERNGYSGDNISYVSGLDIRSDTSEIIGCEGISGDGPVERANANLIAAAPDLYEALEAMTEMAKRMDFSEGVCCCGDSVEGHGFGSGHSPVDAGLHYSSGIINNARAALAKARGES